MYKNIDEFLKERPERIISWPNTSMKAEDIHNPLMISEIASNILNYISCRYCKGVCKLCDQEIDFALYDLHRKQKSLVKKYWDSVVECNKVSNELDTYYNKY